MENSNRQDRHFCVPIRCAWLASLLLATAATAQATPNDGDEALAATVLEALENYERQYDNIDIEWTYQYRLTHPDPLQKMEQRRKNAKNAQNAKAASTGSSLVLSQVVECRRVSIGARYYRSLRRREEGIDGIKSEGFGVMAYDGQQTRKYSTGMKSGSDIGLNTGNIHDNRLTPHRLFAITPYHLCFSFLRYQNTSCRDYLAAVLPPHPRFTLTFRNRAKRDGTIDGLRVTRVTHFREQFKDGVKVNDEIADLWLADDRNYLPVRFEGYVCYYQDGKAVLGSTTIPFHTGKTWDFREAKPGLWVAHRSHEEDFRQDEILKGIRVPSNMRDGHIHRIELDPVIDEKLFSSVEFPVGTHVFELQGGKVVRDYILREGGEEEETNITKSERVRSSWGWWPWVVGTFVLLAGAWSISRLLVNRKEKQT